MPKPVILTGLRANSDLHIGNYFGALLPIIDLAKKHAGDYQINLFVPDLHSFTTPIDHSKLYEQTIHNLRLFVAAGLPLDSDDIHIYRQSFVPAHSELTWILDCFTGFGELSRMTEFKDKSTKLGAEHIGVGQFNYPALMAADIMLYNAVYVPVGDDQRQHIEFTRNVAERMNSKFGELFTVPKSVKEQHEFFGKDQGLRIKDLVDPTKKMSKSDASDRGIIFLGDTPDEAAKKIMGATTDSLNVKDLNSIDPQAQPGLANLLQILSLISQYHDDVNAVPNVIEGYANVKQAVADAVKKFLIAFQANFAQVDDQVLMAKLTRDEAAMNQQANATLLKVQKAVGLRSES